MFRSRLLLCGLLAAASIARAGTITLDFEGYSDGSSLTEQYSDFSFTNTEILSAGLSLNELEFPPHSGINVAADSGGPITIGFSTPVLDVFGFFTYSSPITIQAFDSLDQIVATTDSAFNSNFVSSGNPPNELLGVSFATGISSVVITGDSAGSSFALDDLTVTPLANSVSETATGLMVPCGLLFALLLGALRRETAAGIAILFVAFGMAALAADPVIGTVTVAPTFVPPSTPTQVTITALITDPFFIANGANVQRLDATGRPIAVLGVLHDDGFNGDLVAGDHIYTLVFTLNEPNLERIAFQTTAAFRGVLQRVPSSRVAVDVANAPSPLTIDASSTPAPNASGWNKQDVLVTFSCAGGAGGLDVCPGIARVSVEGRAEAISGTATDGVGNAATKTVTLNIDKTAPLMTVTSPVNGATVNAPSVTISGTVNDALSGVASLTCNGQSATVNGPTFSCSVTLAAGSNSVALAAIDVAGNPAILNLNVTYSASPLTITGSAVPLPNTAGWNNTNVAVSFACIGGTGTLVCPQPVVVSNEGANQVITRTASDGAGSTAIASVTLKIDKTPPVLTITSPTPSSAPSAGPISVTGTATDALSGVATVLCNSSPATLTGTMFSCNVLLAANSNAITVQALDVAGNSSSATVTLSGASGPTITLTAPDNLSYTNISPTTVTGSVSDPSATVVINSVPAVVANGQFSTALPLAEGPNIITATATDAAGTSTASIQVTLDTTPPHVTITSPPDKFVTTDASVSIAGNVNDIVVGTVNDQQAQVTVNGTAAQVANRTFLATNVPLNLGDNLIQATATDRVGNAATTQITVTRQAPSQSQRIQLISGNNQADVIGAVLGTPLVVALTDASGNPAPNKPVIFKVTQDDGMVNAGGAPAASLIATTNAQGQAQVQWTLGQRAGAGENVVEAYAVGFAGTAIFTATGNPGPVGKIVIDTGNNQVGAISQPLPKPLIAVVVDAGNNRLANVPVTFTVKQGGGSLGTQGTASFTLSQGSSSVAQTSVTVNSDSDGRVAVILTLGFQEGDANNLLEANFAGNTGFPASFTASGRAPGDPSKTTISGVVLDNSNVPIPGVTIRAVLTNVLNSNSTSVQAAADVQTDAQGQFLIPQAPVGFVKLLVDGSTAQLPGKYPALDYDLVTVAGQNNTVTTPIYLLPLSAANQLCVTATTGGGTLTIPEAPGFSLTFGPGQVTFPGGSQTGCVSVTSVHSDRVPMTPGFGQQPRFIVTIQPSGALFNPPAPITLPNVDGLRPREVTEMYSFDHDIGSFVAIGTGTVSDDGSAIRSNAGVGVLKAGWHCGGNPTASGAAATCPICMFCQGTQCTPQGNGTACAGTGACQFTGPGQQPSCNCPTGQLLVNNSQCQTPPNCSAGTTFNVSTGQCCGNGQCRTPPNCPAGTTFDVSTGQCCGNGQCYTPPNCPIGTSFDASTGLCCGNGQCQTPPNCPPGTTFSVSTGQCCGSGQCKNPPTCTPPQVLVNGQCQVPPNCPAGTTFDVSTGQCCGNGQCQCPSGQVLDPITNTCVSSIAPGQITGEVLNQDDPITTSFNSLPDGLPVFGGSGDSTSDKLILHAIADPNSPPVTTFAWSVMGPGAAGYTPPNNAADWSVGAIGAQSGILSFKVTMTLQNGNQVVVTRDIPVGIRSDDVLVVGWIDPTGVPLSTTGVSSDVVDFFPPNGSAGMSATQKTLTVTYLASIAVGNTTHPTDLTVPLTAIDKAYILDWMFLYAANVNVPPDQFAEETAVIAYESTPTDYKLFNRLQIKYLSDGSNFLGVPQVIKQSTDVGVTNDPIYGVETSGRKGPNDAIYTSLANRSYLINDGTPDRPAVSAFNTLASPLRWNDIGSRIELGVPYGPGQRITTQIYPTYFIYKNLVRCIPCTVTQAPVPIANFNTNPYPPGPAPFIP